MNEILGFIVLTSPLFLIVLWVPVCIVLAVWIARRFLRKRKIAVKVAVGILIFFFALAMPIADEIAGRIYFNHLCETEAGAKVYQTIGLPAEYWDENGKPNFYYGATNNDIPPYAFERVEAEVIPKAKEKIRLFHIEQIGTTYTDKKSSKIISETTGFRYWGGWVVRNFSLHNTATSCNIAESDDELIKKQFVPEVTERR